MKTVSVPFAISDDDRIEELFSDRILDIFLGLKAKRVSLFFGNAWKDMARNTSIIQRAIKHFARYDIEVAIWLNSFIHNAYDSKYTAKKYIDGSERLTCPLDVDFIQDFACDVAEYAKTGVPLIYLDDDFRLGVSGGLNCFCDLHMAEYRKILGEDITREKIATEILSGKPNIYRDAWSKVNGNALKQAAQMIRMEVDKIDPNVRIGLCASPPTMFGFDGVTAFELSNILAGNNEPFLRTIGAPYWAAWANWDWKARLADIIGLERLEAFYAEELGFKGEMISEGDTYPRPRYTTPASYLELFHSALCTENRMDGILKYLGEYTCKGTYETGYSKLALKNQEKLEKLQKAFENSEKVGYRIFEYQDKSKSKEILPDDISSMEYRTVSLHASIRAMNDASMPYTFSGKEPVVAFGDNTSYLSEKDFECGVLTDISGAKILTKKGIDVGFYGTQERWTVSECGELFSDYAASSYVMFNRAVELYDSKVSAQAQILTYTEIDGKKIPLMYRYESNGRKFVVCCFNMDQARFSLGLFQSYSKQRVLADCYHWFKGEAMSAVCFDSPMLMPIVAKKDNKLIVGLWNIFEDGLYKQSIYLGKEYSEVECIGCSGRLEGKTFVLDELSAFDYCAIILK